MPILKDKSVLSITVLSGEPVTYEEIFKKTTEIRGRQMIISDNLLEQFKQLFLLINKGAKQRGKQQAVPPELIAQLNELEAQFDSSQAVNKSANTSFKSPDDIDGLKYNRRPKTAHELYRMIYWMCQTKFQNSIIVPAKTTRSELFIGLQSLEAYCIDPDSGEPDSALNESTQARAMEVIALFQNSRRELSINPLNTVNNYKMESGSSLPSGTMDATVMV